jgi:hypothetical protein
MATATYLYCLVQSARKPSVAHVPPGLPGAAPVVPAELAERLWIAHAQVPLDRYGPGPLEASLKDLDWVSRIALAHEAVVEHFATRPGATVIPMKLFTMFSTVERAIAAMRGRGTELRRVFARLEGCEEWGVRVLRSERRKPAGRSLRSSMVAKPPSGTAFLTARKQARDDARAELSAAATAADAVYASLSRIAAEHRRRTGEAPGVVAPLLDAAFLVPTRRRARFQTAAQQVARQVSETGAQMTLTGPWPPYNFVGSFEEAT